MLTRDGEVRFRLGELFCGPGGMSLGASLARVRKDGFIYRIESEWATDIDADSCETFRRNILPTRPDRVIEADIRKLDISSLSPVDGIAFGFPCNDYSMVGEQKGFNGHYGPLYTYGVKAIETHNPLWFVAENVSGLQSANEGMAFRKILADLQHVGFGYVVTPHLYRFEDYKVPQTRHRIIIVGVRQDLGLKFNVPEPTTPVRRRTSWDALCDPPIHPDSANNEVTKQSSQVIERLNHIPPGGNAWCDQIPDHLKLNVPRVRMSHIYKRLDPQKPAYTVTGSGGGGTHVYHWSEPRALTNRERARIQTFPDHFVFSGSKESVRKQIGMAVPPTGARAIFEALLKTLAGIPYPSITENVDLVDTQVQLVLYEQYNN